MLFLTMLLGCEVAPRFVHEASEVDAYLVRGAIASACVALDNRQDDSLRTYTTQELVKLTTNPTASRCLCAAVYRPEEHRMDPAVMKGLVRSQRDDLALCAAKALEDAEVPDRPAVATAIGNLDAPKGYEALGAIAAADGPMDLRLAATRALRLGTGTKSTLMGILDHEDPALRTAAAEALTGRRDDEIATRAKRLLDEDPSVEVRAAALGMLVGADERGSQRAVCKVLMEDTDATMRAGAARAFHGSRERGAIDCLKRRLLDDEQDPAVRTAAMDALGASPDDRAAKTLCELIGPMMKLYVKDSIAEATPGVDIAKHQNDRDHEQSYACVEAALRTPGLSCYAKNHLGKWMNDLGGKASRPWCPGMERR